MRSCARLLVMALAVNGVALQPGCGFDSSGLAGVEGGTITPADGGEDAPAADRPLPADRAELLDSLGDAGVESGPADARVEGGAVDGTTTEAGAGDAASDGPVCSGSDRCDGDTLVTCGPAGDVRTACDHGCNATRVACNDCTPTLTACATAQTLVTCTSDGLVESSITCDHGCNSARSQCNVCSPGQTTCVSDHLLSCGADGTVAVDSACTTLGCDGASPPHCWQLSPSNGLGARMDLGSASVTLNQPDQTRMIIAHTGTGALQDCVRDGSDCRDLIAPTFAVVSQTGGPSIGVWSVGSLTVAAKTLVVFVGPNVAAITARSTITISGAMSASAYGPAGGPGAASGGAAQAGGAGAAAGGAGASGSNTAGTFTADDAGGGGGGYGGGGGAGGDAGSLSGGAAGTPPYGTPQLVPLMGGSGGGGGGDIHGGWGGGGGGGLQLVAGTAINVAVDAAVVAAGAGGEGGQIGDCTDSGAAGGGGAGGGLLLEAPAITIDGFISVNGGGGGAGAVSEDASTCQIGPDGQTGLVGATPTPGGAGSGTGGGGGTGGAGTQLAGTNGAAATNGGGGGGGAGRLRINARSTTGSLGSGSVSPTLGTAAATRGAVALR